MEINIKNTIESRRTFSMGMVLLTAILLAALILPVHGTESDVWPQFHLDPEHSGSSPFAVPRDNQTAWISENIGAQPGSSVSVADGKVFVNCINHLVSLEQSSGKVLWNSSFEPRPDTCNVFGFTPAYSDGKVFLSANRTVCLSAEDGRELWNFAPQTGKGAVDGSPAVSNGRVLVSDWDGHHYYCLDESTGRELWNYTVMGYAQSTPAISEGKAVFGGWEWGKGGRIYCVHLENGSLIWSLGTENSPCGSAAISNGVVYMTAFNFEGEADILALSLQNGSVLWKEKVERTDSTPALAQGRAYICGGVDGFSNLSTYCFDASRGELIWKTEPDEMIGDWRCSPAYADGLVFAGRLNGSEYAGLCALNATTGELVWSHPAGGASPAIADGMVFSIGDGRVYAFGEGDKP